MDFSTFVQGVLDARNDSGRAIVVGFEQTESPLAVRPVDLPTAELLREVVKLPTSMEVELPDADDDARAPRLRLVSFDYFP